MSSKTCPHCDGTDFDSSQSIVCCTTCGYVIAEGEIVNQQTFSETSSGGASADGQFVSSSGRSYRGGVPGLGRVSREVTIDNARKRIQNLAAVLGLSAFHVDAAVRLFMLALQHNFVKGRRSENVVSACLYVVCRREKTSHMLLDFADVLNTNVYILGHTFLNFCSLLNLELPIIDPSLYINRFAAKLGFEDKVQQVASTALRLVQRMRRDWIITGRRPSGICGAALLIAARVHGFQRTVSEVVSVVKICEVTIRKRLSEFEGTAASKLTPEEFELIELEQEMDPPCYTAGLKKAKERELKEKRREERRKKKEAKKKSKPPKKKRKKTSKKKKKDAQQDEEEQEEEQEQEQEVRDEVDPLLNPSGQVTAELEREMEEMMNRAEFRRMEDDVNEHLNDDESTDTQSSMLAKIQARKEEEAAEKEKQKEKEAEEENARKEKGKEKEISKENNSQLGDEGRDGTQDVTEEGEKEALPGNSVLDETEGSQAVPSSMASKYSGPTDPSVQVRDPYWQEGQPFYWELMEEDDGNLSEFDDDDIDKYIYTPEEAKARQEIWEELNKDYLLELEEKKKQEAIDFPNGKPVRAPRKRKRTTKAPTADTPGKAAATVLEKKIASSKINYKALESLLSESAFEESRAREERMNKQKAGNTSSQPTQKRGYEEDIVSHHREIDDYNLDYNDEDDYF